MIHATTNPLVTIDASAGADEKLLRTLAAETDRLIAGGAQRYNRYGLMFDVRYALWEDQNDEGIKVGPDAFPWPGASDTRVRLADKIIRERLAIRQAAFYGKRLQARALRGAQTGAATLVNVLLKWMLYNQALPMIHRETQLGWNYADTYGAAVMGCFWRQRTQLAEETMDLRSLVQMAQETQDPQLAAMIQMIVDPLQEEMALQAFAEAFPGHTVGERRGILRRLRREGSAQVRRPYVTENEVDWLALRPGIDVFFDASLDDLQKAPLITVRELLTEADVRERAEGQGWDQDFIDQAVKHSGKTTFDSAIDPLRLSPRGFIGRRGVMAEDQSQRIEILTSFYRVHERGTSALYQTVYHRSVSDVAALHLLHTYDHGQMPFTAWRSETTERPILESRGVPEICLTWQTEEKTERDFLTDRMSMEVLPTLLVPRNRAGTVLIGPGAQIERTRSEEISFLQFPQTTPTAGVSRELRIKEICEYFGRAHPEADPTMVQLLRQQLVTNSLTDLIPLVQQTWGLMQQYLTDEEIAAVLGPIGQGLRLGRTEIQGQFAVEFTYDVRNLDPEFLTTLVGVVKETVPLDRMGTIDLSGIVEFIFHSIAPDLAEKFVRPQQAAQMQDVDDEMRQLAGIALGIEPPQKEVSNAALRLQVLEQTLQSPRYQQIVASDQTGVVAQLLENQQAKYRFQLEQQQNAVIGKTGVKPVLGGPGDGLPAMGGGAQ